MKIPENQYRERGKSLRWKSTYKLEESRSPRHLCYLKMWEPGDLLSDEIKCPSSSRPCAEFMQDQYVGDLNKSATTVGNMTTTLML